MLAKPSGSVDVPSPVIGAFTLTLDSTVVGSADTQSVPFQTNISFGSVPSGTVPVIVTLLAAVNLP